MPHSIKARCRELERHAVDWPDHALRTLPPRLDLMPSTLRSPAVVDVLARLFEQVEQQDPLAKQRVQSREAEIGHRLPQAQRYELYGEAPLAITRDVGELLYTLVLGTRARKVVEFGSSLGISTIFLAAAIRDSEHTGSVIATEMLQSKVQAARRHLTEAGLEDLVELRPGDALQTLADLDEPVDLLFLDGRNDLYLPVLRLLEPRLAPSVLVAADLNADDPDLSPYLGHVRDPAGGYFSTTVPLDAGVELSIRLPVATTRKSHG
jgi:predicted O-methyltransferase YrrM